MFAATEICVRNTESKDREWAYLKAGDPLPSWAEVDHSLVSAKRPPSLSPSNEEKAEATEPGAKPKRGRPRSKPVPESGEAE